MGGVKRSASGLDSGKRPNVDKDFPGKGQVFGEGGSYWDAMLNQTNVGANNNKFYIVQLIDEGGGKFCCWTHWGRVGEPGQTKKEPGPSLDAAKKAFKKKFREKTQNDWENRAAFKAVKGKYTLIEVKAGGGGGGDAKKAKTGPAGKCTLDKPVQDTVSLIFNHDMFKDSMKEKGLDVDKMPLGELSQAQVKKGVAIMEQIEKAVEGKKKAKLAELSSQYFTAIPHSFGWKKVPTIDSLETVQKEFDLLNMLADITTGVAAGKSSESGKAHPDDINYKSLNAKLVHVPPSSKEHKIISKYFASTARSSTKILDVFSVDRSGEGGRFKAHAKIKNRKLLWHGTSVAVVVAILKSGLRIMPHSGGRVGKGIYLASENSKSAGYVGTVTKGAGRWGGTPGVGYMLLCEAALGKEKEIDKDNSSLKAAPPGFDSIIARGRSEPDLAGDTTMKIDGNDVTVPQAKPKTTKWKSSNFSQSEYLLYKESQVRIRYLLKCKF